MRSVRNILACLLLAASLAGRVYESGYGHRYGGGDTDTAVAITVVLSPSSLRQ